MINGCRLSGFFMRLLRLFVILANLVSLPGYGLAATGHVRACPERTAATAVVIAAHGMAMSHDCCPGATDQRLPAKPDTCAACVAGFGCKHTQAVQLVTAPRLAMVSWHQSVVEDPALHVSLCGPDRLLRPPRLS